MLRIYSTILGRATSVKTKHLYCFEISNYFLCNLVGLHCNKRIIHIYMYEGLKCKVDQTTCKTLIWLQWGKNACKIFFKTKQFFKNGEFLHVLYNSTNKLLFIFGSFGNFPILHFWVKPLYLWAFHITSRGF